VRRGCGQEESVPGLSLQKVSARQHEQGWSVYTVVDFRPPPLRNIPMQ